VIGGFFIGERYCILHALNHKKEFGSIILTDFHNSPNHQNNFYTKFSSYMVYIFVGMDFLILMEIYPLCYLVSSYLYIAHTVESC